ncbi:MAG: S26 family signal peptidase [Halobacteriaceae archaeon]
MSEDDPNPWQAIQEYILWIRDADHPGVVFVREALSSAIVVLLIGLILFAASGVWPPLVAVRSGSMEPNLHRGDLVFIMDENRLVPGPAIEGVVTYQMGKEIDYQTFGDYGNVIIFDPPTRRGPPIIHRARMYVQKGENWVKRARSEFLYSRGCDEVPYCPAPYAGFITKGDNNPTYDQTSPGLHIPIVKPSWITGTAEFHVPYLGYVRLIVSEFATSSRMIGTGLMFNYQTALGYRVEPRRSRQVLNQL